MNKVRQKQIEKLDSVFSKYIRLHKADENGYCKCITCGKIDYWKDMDAGHYIPRKHMATRWDVYNVYPQCISCNRYKDGAEEAFMDAIGDDLATHLHQAKHKVTRYSLDDLEQLIELYSDKIIVYGVHR